MMNWLQYELFLLFHWYDDDYWCYSMLNEEMMDDWYNVEILIDLLLKER